MSQSTVPIGAIAFLLSLGMGCSTGPNTSSSSHWLSCETDADCDNWNTLASCGPDAFCVNTQGVHLEQVDLLAEEFTADLDSSTFGYEEGFSVRNGDAEYYTARAENVFIEQGELVLRAQAETYEDAAYTSGSVTTQGKFSFTYGKVEARIWAPDGAGTGPAFWLLPEAPGPAELYCPDPADAASCLDSQWPVWGDVVIMTTRSQTPTAIIQSSNYGVWDETLNAVVRGEQGGTTVAAQSIADGYHDYAIVWGPDRIDWYFDGELSQSFDTTLAYEPSGQNPFDRPFYIKLNLAVGGLAETPDPSVYPQDMRVQHLRVTQYQ